MKERKEHYGAVSGNRNGMDMQNPEEETDSNDLSRFKKSLQELRDLRSQLHYAADYCERTFFIVNEKKLVMENTKEYICRAVVTVVDHLGSVSTNLECQLSNNKVISAAELRINCLKQRLLACEQYSHKVALTKVCCSLDIQRHCSHYIAPSIPNLEKSNDELRTMSKHGIEDDLPLFLYTRAHESPSTTVSTIGNGVQKYGTDPILGFDFSTLFPVRNVPPMLSKPQTPFHFQGTQKLGHKERTRKSVQSNDFLFLLRRSKRAM